MDYRNNKKVSAKEIADLRQSVDWNRMERQYADEKFQSFYHIACYDKDRLVGYVDSVSNGVTDAYIQDLMVTPDYQGRGIGSELMQRMIAGLTAQHIYMISCIYAEESLADFYSRFGFPKMYCGQFQTYESE